MCEVQQCDESASRFPCTLYIMHEVRNRGDIVDEVKITLPISSPGSEGDGVKALQSYL